MDQTDDILITLPHAADRTIFEDALGLTSYPEFLTETAEYQLQWLIRYGLDVNLEEKTRLVAIVLLTALTEETTAPTENCG